MDNETQIPIENGDSDTSAQDSGEVSNEARLRTEVMAQVMNRRHGPLDEETAGVLTRVYLARRIRYQMDWYQGKVNNFEGSSDFAFRVGAAIMSLTSLLATYSAAPGSSGILPVLTAILPAFAALVASFRQLYQWDRQVQLYRDTMLGLERASLVLPDLDQMDNARAAQIFPELVTRAEQVFKDEVSQWGQIALGSEKEEEKEDSLRSFARDYGIDIYRGDGTVDEDKLDSIRQILTSARNGDAYLAPNLSVGYPTINATSEISRVVVDNDTSVIDAETTDIDDGENASG